LAIWAAHARGKASTLDRPRCRRCCLKRRESIVEKSFLPTLRAGVVTALALPFGLAAFAAGLTNGEPPLEIMGPLLALVVSLVATCWSRIAAHWRAQRRHDDDDDEWRREGGEDPRLPDDGSGGPVVDWPRFEREFAAYVAACERVGDRVLSPAR
jgi:hypothetical protein